MPPTLITRRTGLGLAAGLALPWIARAQAWPTKAVRFVVPFAPGGSSEIVARATAAELSKSLGQSVYVRSALRSCPTCRRSPSRVIRASR